MTDQPAHKCLQCNFITYGEQPVICPNCKHKELKFVPYTTKDKEIHNV